MIEVVSGIQRYEYHAYPHQKRFHESTCPHRLVGGAAGPGKTLALIEDDLFVCNQFPRETAPQVHTVIFRRTHPKLEATVITRFREKIPKELYADYNEQKHVVTWLNGATTQFGSMQYEHDVWGWQGQWMSVKYDELTEFTFPQWQNISAWNRCPVSKRATKDGATNPIGVGARWVEDLFVKGKPCAEMDQNQRQRFKPEDYAYFPATYLDNPIYANDTRFLEGLDSYRGPVAQALKMGIWGIAGGYFDGAWDEAYNVYRAETVRPEKWWKKWLGGDWGFEHNSAIKWFCMDGLGIVRIYRELVCNHHTPEELGERIVSMSRDEDGNQETYEKFSFSHDAFAQRQDAQPIGLRISKVLTKAGLCSATSSTRDKPGREQILYDYLKGRVKVGEVFNDAEGRTEPVMAAKLQISDACPNLISTISTAPRDEKNMEEIAEFLGDDSLAGAGYGLYAMFGRPSKKPLDLRVKERLDAEPNATINEKVLAQAKIIAEEKAKSPHSMPIRRRPRTWNMR